MSPLVVLNLAVQDVARSKAFFSRLGFSFQPDLEHQCAASMTLDGTAYVVLMQERFFAHFTPKRLVDASRSTESIVVLNLGSRAQVDEMAVAAFAAGGRRYREPEDLGFMYGWGFEDPDGHLWELVYLDPAMNDDRRDPPAPRRAQIPEQVRHILG